MQERCSSRQFSSAVWRSRAEFSPGRARPPHEPVRRLVFAGLAFVARTPGTSTVVGLIGAQAFVRGCLNVLIVVTAFEVLDADAGAVGYMTAALGVGGLIGASVPSPSRDASLRSCSESRWFSGGSRSP